MFRVDYNPLERFRTVRTPAWAQIVANSVCEGATVRIGVLKASGKLALYCIIIPDAFGRDKVRAEHFASRIRAAIERQPKFRKGSA